VNALSLSEKFELLSGAISYRALAQGEARWLRPELVRTEVARERVRTWAASGAFAALSTDDVEYNLRPRYIGDVIVRAIVAEALTKIAPPVRDLVLSTCWIFEVGKDATGWFGALPTARAESVINLNGDRPLDELASTFAHECAHAWLHPMPRPTASAYEAGAGEDQRATLLGLAGEWKMPHVVLAPRIRAEWQAASLAAAWGFTGAAASGEHCARAAREGLTAQINAAMQKTEER
jgi:hypothetical protein